MIPLGGKRTTFDHCFRGVLVSFREVNGKSKLENPMLCFRRRFAPSYRVGDVSFV